MTRQRTTGVRLGSFALILVGTFGTAYAIGERLPGHNHSSNSSHHHAHDAATSPVASGAEMNGYQLVTEAVDATSATFSLRDPSGAAVTAFERAHGALLHAILIRPDLSDFQHVHPQIGSDGSWRVAIEGAGQWHLVFESVPMVDGVAATQAVIVTADIDDDTVVDSVALPVADDTVEVDGLVVTRDGFTFRVANADGSVATDLEPYLEQVAHLVAIRAGDLAYLHLHPLDSATGTFEFGTGISAAGTYRLFLQFGHAGSVLTIPFTVVIA